MGAAYAQPAHCCPASCPRSQTSPWFGLWPTRPESNGSFPLRVACVWDVAWKAGATVLVIRVFRDPAENTSTSPLGLELAELVALGELEELAELLDELLHAASPMHARDASAAICTPRR